MRKLSTDRCIPCSKGATPLTDMEIEALLDDLPGWGKVEIGRVPCLNRTFNFPDFSQALAFTNRIGALAEQEGHHPLLVTEWGKVTVRWWTHKIAGLHRNDFIMAAKTSELFATMPPETS